MGFFYQQTQAQAARVKTVKSGRPQDMPKETLQRLSCSACPRNKADLRHPKMLPTGPISPQIVILGPAPTEKDDKLGEYFTGDEHKVLFKQIPRSRFDTDVTMLGMLQCGGAKDPTESEIECCRLRVVGDIEALKPQFVLTVGSAALKWATNLDGGFSVRGSRFIPTRFGEHQCWVVSLPDSDWKGLKPGYYGPSPHMLVYERSVKEVLNAIADQIDPPNLPSGPYDSGIVCITGQEAGDIERLEEELVNLAKLSDVGIDYETNALRPYQVDDPHIWTCAIGPLERVVAFPLDHPEAWPNPEHRKRAWAAMARFLLDSGDKIAHNLSMEHIWTAWFFGPEILRTTTWQDTMAQAHTLDEREGTKSLDDCTRMHFGFFVKDQSRVDPVRLLEYPIKEALRYNALDSKWTHALYHAQRPLIEQERAYVREYKRKVSLCPTLVLTELLGLPCDDQYARDMLASFEAKSAESLRKIQACPEVRAYTKKFGKFEPSSPEQVLVLLRDICDRPEIKKTNGEGAITYTTSEDAISVIPASEVPSVALILEQRQSEKLVGTYLKPIVEKRIVHRDGCMHPTYNSMKAVTGRLSSEDPNGQNWPKRKNKEIRGVVYAPDGHIFVAKDYGQIEARVIAMASEDKNLVEYLWTGYEIHGYWADRIFKVYPKWYDFLCREFELNGDDEKLVRKTGRQEAKNKWVFPQFFGSSFKSCAANLHVPLDKAEDLMEEFWDEFRGVKKWQDKLLNRYEKDLYVETLTGRRRRGALSKNEIINTPIQGTAADIVLAAMDALSEEAVLTGDMTFHPRLNVHDDLSAIPYISDMQHHIERSAEIMCKHRFDFINVPLVVEVETGPRWSELKKFGEFRSDVLFNLPNPYSRG